MKYNLYAVRKSIHQSALRIVTMALVSFQPLSAFAGSEFDGLGYVSIKGPNETQLFTGIPSPVTMAISGKDLDKNNVSYSVLNALAVAGGSFIKFANTVDANFIVLIFSDNAISDVGVNLSELKGFEKDAPMVAALQDSYKPGVSCVSAAVFSDRGTFLRSLILSNNNISNEELAQCSLEAGAHAFGISTASADYKRAGYSDQIGRFSKMIQLKKECVDRGNITVQCVNEALEEVRDGER